jgi:hypothetical protein
MCDKCDPRDGTIGNHGADGELGQPGITDPPPKPKRGRPSKPDDPCGTVSVWLPNRTQDHIIRLAKRRRQTPSEYLRDVLNQLFSSRY